ncbi:hypothetical protein HYH03_000765 [Edaphochlamys debaryana]|uniref:Uncharacterized protein n=1 Tax=Edaphochlamys debaryana TaxID=47281 RepID=A0A835YDL7_9CHLO|nr:hypothetical protein HYH03_000765 [Edaphochlamys debaryana]|eukprot:KAG2500940.1 hypothetical protein HYH03_000765 [Edaphochlamys debaryana]
MAEAQPDEPCEDVDPSRVWQPALLANVARFLPSVALTHILRLVDSVAADELKEHKIVEFSDSSEPIPPYMIPALVAHASRPSTLLCAGLNHRRQLVRWAAASGDLASLKAMIEAVGVVPTSLELGAAAAVGDLEACRWLLEQGCPVSDRNGRALDDAAGAGQRVACEWLIAHGAKVTESAVWAAARAGHAAADVDFDILVSRELIKSIAAGCDLATLKRWWPQLRETDTLGVTIASAAASPTPDWQEKVAWLAAEGVDATVAGFEAAARPDGITRLEWLVERFEYEPRMMDLTWAVEQKRGTAETVEWLLQRLPKARFSEEEEVFFGFMRPVTQRSAGGSVAKLKALHEAGCLDTPMSPPEMMLTDALRCGYPDAAMWLINLIRGLRRRKSGLEEIHYKFAATSGNPLLMTMLSLLRCPMGSSAWGYRERLQDQDRATLAGARQRPAASGTPYAIAAVNGDLRTLGLLRRLGMPFGPSNGRAFCDAVGSGAAPLPALKWLVEAGFPVRWGAAVKALGQRQAGDCEAVRAWVEAQRQAAGEEE